MKSVKRMVVDIETLGVNSRSPVLSIGAVILAKDLSIEDRVRDIIEWRIDASLYDYFNGSFVVDFSTIKWWVDQKLTAKKTAFTGSESPGIVCQELADIYREAECGEIWANHPQFDVVILENLFKQYDVKVPWNYYDVFDTATIKLFLSQLKRDEFKNDLVAHVASDDAIYEARCLQWLLPKLKVEVNNDILY